MGKLRNLFFGAPLHTAASKGDLTGVQKLIETGSDVNEHDSFGATPIFYAAGNGKTDVVKFLIGKGADVNAPKKNNGMTPLIIAAAGGHSSVVRLLIEHGADLKAMDNTGQTALDFARSVSGDKATIDILSNAQPRANDNTSADTGFKFSCPHCQQSLEAESDMAGQNLECPACNKAITVPAPPAPKQEEKTPETRQRFRVERVAFIVLTAVIAGLAGGSKTDLGPFGLMSMVAFLMFCFYGAAKTLLGIGGFSETVRVGAKIPGFDWKRFMLDPLYFIGVCLALLLLTGLIALFKWAFSGGK